VRVADGAERIGSAGQSIFTSALESGKLMRDTGAGCGSNDILARYLYDKLLLYLSPVDHMMPPQKQKSD